MRSCKGERYYFRFTEILRYRQTHTLKQASCNFYKMIFFQEILQEMSLQEVHRQRHEAGAGRRQPQKQGGGYESIGR